MKRYKFIGQDGSMGFRNGEYYWGIVLTKHNTDFPKYYPEHLLFIPILVPNSVVVPYSSEETFNQNWEMMGKIR